MMHSRSRSVGFWFAAAALSLFSAGALASPVGKDDAAKAVAGWLRQPGHGLKARLGDVVKEVEVFTDGAGAPAYYVVYLKPSGYVIVPADDLVEPILAFGASGRYVASDQNPLYALVVRDVPARLAQARGGAGNAFSRLHGLSVEQKWQQLRAAASSSGILPGLSSVSDPRVDPFVQSHWDQGNVSTGYCYDYFTPNHDVCGCVATAMAQLMRFYQYPTSGVGTAESNIWVNGVLMTNYHLRGGDGNGGPYDWADMPLNPGNSATDTQRQAVGSLCYDAGVAVHMQYTTYSGSGASPTDIAPALTNVFLYSNCITGGNGGNTVSGLTGMLNPNLDAGLPCLLSIYGPGVGHEIVADGYGYDSSTLYHHLNLGWSGIDDAWYNLPDFITPPYNWTMVSFCTYNVYVVGSGEIISGRITDGTGSPVAGATVTATRTGGGIYTATTSNHGVYAFPKVPSASSYTLNASKAGYTFSPQTVSTGTSATWASISGDVWGADFVPVGTPTSWTLNVTSAPLQGVAITGTYPGATNYSASSVPDGTAISLTAPATMVSGATTYNFVKWTVPTGWTFSGATVSGTIHAGTTLEADYAAQTQTWTLNVNSAPIQGVMVLGTQPGTTNYSKSSVPDGTAVSLTAPATALSGTTTYNFVKWTVPTDWTVSGATVSGSVHANTTLEADYTANQPGQYALNVQSTPVAGITVSSTTADGGVTNYTLNAASGAAVNLSAPATDPAGYVFADWKVTVGTAAPVVTAQKSASFTLSANTTAVAEYQAAPPPPTGTVKINFQPTTAPVPAGYLPDAGLVYQAQNGQTYGWKTDSRMLAAKRNINPDERLDTLIQIQGSMQWAIALPNGPYNVLVCVGDPAYNSTCSIAVSGVTYFSKSWLPANQFLTMTKPVWVTTGQLTINMGSAPSLITPIAYVEITPANGAQTLSVQSTPMTGIAVSSTTGQAGTTNYTKSATPGSAVSLTAPAADPAGYSFLDWKVTTGSAAPVVTAQKTVSFSMSGDTIAVAEYQSGYTLSAQSTPVQGAAMTGTYPGTTNYSVPGIPSGTAATLTAPATDPAGYVFVDWKVTVGTAAPVTTTQKTTSFTLNAGATAVAEYKVKSGPIKINFQPASAPIPAGYIADAGLVYQAQSGQTYGWKTDCRALAAKRNINPDGRLDTLIPIQSSMQWAIALPNGPYNVLVCVGDPAYNSTCSISVSGWAYWSKAWVGQNAFLTMTKTVWVTTGKLTVDMGSTPSLTTPINYIEIAPPGVSAGAEGADTTVSATSAEAVPALAGKSAEEPSDVIVDNLDNTAAKQFKRLSGAWGTNALGGNAWAGSFVYTPARSGAEDARARFLCTTLGAGRYDVYAWWPTRPDRAANVAYEVHHADGVTVVRVNQSENGGKWNLLGTFDFAAGSHVVDVQNGQSKPGAFISADAVRFVTAGGALAP